MRRSIALLLLILLVGFTWGRSRRPPLDPAMKVEFVPLTVAAGARPEYHLGHFRLEGMWHLKSRSALFGSYSALLAMPDGSLLAISDGGDYLRFMPPDGSGRIAQSGRIFSDNVDKRERDVESATRDPATDAIWLGLEGTNSIARLGPTLRAIRRVHPAANADWGRNSGAEAMTRLAGGRFVLLREGFDDWFARQRHDAVVFEGDPTKGARSWHFRFDGPAGFSPTDMTQLPDGRMLILMRRLVWPMPQRFAGRIAIADPAEIRPGAIWKAHEVARIASSLPVDNFEGLAVRPGRTGRLIVWIISDDNYSNLQRTILWKLSVDPRQLP